MWDDVNKIYTLQTPGKDSSYANVFTLTLQIRNLYNIASEDTLEGHATITGECNGNVVTAPNSFRIYWYLGFEETFDALLLPWFSTGDVDYCPVTSNV